LICASTASKCCRVPTCSPCANSSPPTVPRCSNTHCNTHCNTLQHALQLAASHCNTLQHSATLCNTHRLPRCQGPFCLLGLANFPTVQIYVYVSIYMCIYVYICTHIPPYRYILRVSENIYMYVYIYIYMYIYMYIYINACVCVCVCVCMCIYIYICIPAYGYVLQVPEYQRALRFCKRALHACIRALHFRGKAVLYFGYLQRVSKIPRPRCSLYAYLFLNVESGFLSVHLCVAKESFDSFV